MKSLFTRSSALALALAAMVATTTAAHAASIGIAPSGGNSYQVLPSPTANNLSGWSNTIFTGTTYGYNFALQTATSAINIAPQQTLVMDGDTTNNGGSVIALDADYEQAAMTTTLSALAGDAAGSVVTLTFDFAGDQQLHGSDGCTGCTGNFDALLDVTLGGASATSGTNDGTLLDAAKGATQDTTTSCATESNVTPCILSQEFSGWETETLTFTLGASDTDVLSFLASDPNAVAQDPAFALIDNLSYTVTPPSTVPEPNSLLLLSTGLLGLGGYIRMRSKAAATKA